MLSTRISIYFEPIVILTTFVKQKKIAKEKCKARKTQKFENEDEFVKNL